MTTCAECGSSFESKFTFCPDCGVKRHPIEEINSPSMIEQYLLSNKPNHMGNITCPRCLGKGCTEDVDIERLGLSEFKTFLDFNDACNYCKGTGLVNVNLIDIEAFPLNSDELESIETKIHNLELLSSVLNQRYKGRDPFDDICDDQSSDPLGIL